MQDRQNVITKRIRRTVIEFLTRLLMKGCIEREQIELMTRSGSEKMEKSVLGIRKTRKNEQRVL
jgi:uncharacterized 2Fe-2S/4Fe-4S cluster protein (DUF4445 family)